MTPLAGECQEIFMAAILAFDAGKAVVQIAAIEITIDHPLDIGPPETVLPGEMFVIDSDKGLKIALHAAVTRMVRVPQGNLRTRSLIACLASDDSTASHNPCFPFWKK